MFVGVLSFIFINNFINHNPNFFFLERDHLFWELFLLFIDYPSFSVQTLNLSPYSIVSEKQTKTQFKSPFREKKKKITKRDNEHIYLSNDNYFYILLIFYFIHLIHSQSDKSLKNKSEDINRLNNFQ